MSSGPITEQRQVTCQCGRFHYALDTAGTPGGRMRAVWAWIHEDGKGREKVLEELCPGWSIVSSRIASEEALMVAFDALVAERESRLVNE